MMILSVTEIPEMDILYFDRNIAHFSDDARKCSVTCTQYLDVTTGTALPKQFLGYHYPRGGDDLYFIDGVLYLDDTCFLDDYRINFSGIGLVRVKPMDYAVLSSVISPKEHLFSLHFDDLLDHFFGHDIILGREKVWLGDTW